MSLVTDTIDKITAANPLAGALTQQILGTVETNAGDLWGQLSDDDKAFIARITAKEALLAIEAAAGMDVIDRKSDVDTAWASIKSAEARAISATVKKTVLTVVSDLGTTLIKFALSKITGG